MKIVAVYPGLNPQLNDIAQVLAFLVHQGHEVHVITARQNRSKSSYDQAHYEVSQGVHIHRLYESFLPGMILRPASKRDLLQEILADFVPDVVICSQEFTVRVGLVLRDILTQATPIVAVSEFAGDLADNGYPGIFSNIAYPLAGMPRGKRFWSWLCSKVDAVITCYPGDIDRLDRLSTNDTSVYFVPWCNQLPTGFQPASEKEKGLAVYIGTFSRWKNTDAFTRIVPAILNETPTERICFVGSGKIKAVKHLRNRFGQRIEHIPGLPRHKALLLLSSAFYGLTPVKRGGWGFIGDCWAVRTPLVALHNDYRLDHAQNALVGTDLKCLVEYISRLYDDPDLYKRLQATGYGRYEHSHAAQAVGTSYQTVLENTLGTIESPQKKEDVFSGVLSRAYEDCRSPLTSGQ
jgi:glycosyltransferase involved in cell wall biosynthesis